MLWREDHWQIFEVLSFFHYPLDLKFKVDKKLRVISQIILRHLTRNFKILAIIAGV